MAVTGVDGAIVILVHTFPLHSTTFIAREVRELRKRGVPLALVAIRAPRPGEAPADAADLLRETVYLLPIGPVTAFTRHVRAAATRPVAYARTLLAALTRGRLGPRDRLRTLLHFGEAICLRPLLDARDCRHLHVHALAGAATVAMLLKEMSGLSYSLTAHGTDIFVEKVLLGEKMQGAAFTRVGTEFNRAYLARLLGRDDPRLVVMPFGVDTGRLAPGPVRPPGSRLRLLSVGRLVWQKAHHLLLDACARLRGEGCDLDLTILGEGDERPALESRRARLGLDDRVALPGAAGEAEVAGALRASDLFVLSSVSEGFGIVLLEAMACGIPVVAPALRGIPEIVTDGVEGRLFRPGSVDDLTRAIRDLAEDPAGRRRMGETGRRKVLAAYRLEERVAAFDRLLRETVGASSWTA